MLTYIHTYIHTSYIHTHVHTFTLISLSDLTLLALPLLKHFYTCVYMTHTHTHTCTQASVHLPSINSSTTIQCLRSIFATARDHDHRQQSKLHKWGVRDKSHGHLLSYFPINLLPSSDIRSFC